MIGRTLPRLPKREEPDQFTEPTPFVHLSGSSLLGRRGRVLLLLGLLLLFAHAAFAQTPAPTTGPAPARVFASPKPSPARGGNNVTVENADTLHLDENNVATATGNVRLRYQEYTLTCGKAVIDTKTGTANSNSRHPAQKRRQHHVGARRGAGCAADFSICARERTGWRTAKGSLPPAKFRTIWDCSCRCACSAGTSSAISR